MSTQVDSCLALALRRADRLVSQLYNRHMESCGLRGTQYAMLRAIHDHDCVTARELSAALSMDQTTVSRALKPLLRDGLIVAREAPIDRREKLLCLTESGRDVYDRASEGWAEAQRELRERLGQRDSGLLLRLTDRIGDALD